MENTNENKTPMVFYVFSTLCVIALTVVAVIPASMVFRLRIFDAFGLPEWIAEVVRFLILIATPAAVLVTGLARVFAVSDAHHARQMGLAAICEGLACVLEIAAALVNGHDIFALMAQAVTMGGAIALVFGALVITITASGFYKLAIAERERSLLWSDHYSKLFKEAMQSDEAREEMLRAVKYRIQDEVERQAGRRIYSRSQIDVAGGNGASDKSKSNGSGNGNHSQKTMAFEVAPVKVKRAKSDNGTTPPLA